MFSTLVNEIEKTIGLDFDTFVNSAFLRQGQSNEFSQKTPKERKQSLANILGLSRYDELSRLALEQMRAHVDEGKILQKIEEQVIEELKEETVVLQKLKEKEGEIATLASQTKPFASSSLICSIKSFNSSLLHLLHFIP